MVGIYKEFLTSRCPTRYWSLILVNAGFNLAFAVWILNAYIGSIPVELEEAAMVDGGDPARCARAGSRCRWRCPACDRADLHVHRGVERVHHRADTHHQPGDYPLTVAWTRSSASTRWTGRHLFGASVIATIPVIILFAFIEGKVVGGLTAGSIK